MEYRQTLENSWTAYVRDHGDGMAISAAALLKWDAPRPKHGDTWGNWQYDAKWMVLTFLPEDYEIDLEECTTSAQLLDWIFQISNKTWMTEKDRSDMLLALNDLLRPQANLCSFGQNLKFDAKKHLKSLARKK